MPCGITKGVRGSSALQLRRCKLDERLCVTLQESRAQEHLMSRQSQHPHLWGMASSDFKVCLRPAHGILLLL